MNDNKAFQLSLKSFKTLLKESKGLADFRQSATLLIKKNHKHVFQFFMLRGCLYLINKCWLPIRNLSEIEKPDYIRVSRGLIRKSNNRVTNTGRIIKISLK